LNSTKTLTLAAATVMTGALAYMNAQSSSGTASSLATSHSNASPSLTIYNGGFATVRDRVALDLKNGINQIVYSGPTRTLEPESVILRDPNGKVAIQILEQNYRNDPISQAALLHVFEGKTIEFQLPRDPGGSERIVSGKVVRSGYESNGQFTEPLIEVGGKLQFGLPGKPIFPSLPENSILKPQLNWRIRAAETSKLDAELAYISNGFAWNADYNLVTEENQDSGDLIGWVTINNQSGKLFENAKIQLMAGDVNKVELVRTQMMKARQVAAMAMEMDAGAPAVTEKSFDEFHLYTLQNPTTLLDRETKQVEFVRAEKMNTKRVFVYRGAPEFSVYDSQIVDPGFGTQNVNKKVHIYREFENKKDNGGLGIPLPKGRLRLYTREGAAGPLQFVGENNIDHTPQGERVKIFVGNAFDLVGERRQTDFRAESRRVVETYEIKLRNRKKTTAEIRVVEPMFRWSTWKFLAQSDPHVKTDSRTAEFRVTLQPDQEKVVTYTVEYRW
jgi:hypothetical protein